MSVPDSIRVKIDALQLGQALHVKELELPAGVTVLDDPEAIVVAIKAPTAIVDVATTEAAANEPEIITKKKEKPTDEE